MKLRAPRLLSLTIALIAASCQDDEGGGGVNPNGDAAAGSGGSAGSSGGSGNAGVAGTGDASAGDASGGGDRDASGGGDAGPDSAPDSTPDGSDGGPPADSCGPPCEPGYKQCARAYQDDTGKVTISRGGCGYERDPASGCAQEVEDLDFSSNDWRSTCDPCSFPNAGRRCSPDGKCAMGACDPGYADCNGDPKDGCEAILQGRRACGACGVVCTGGQYCAGGVCSATCEPPLTNCGSEACPELGASNPFGSSCTCSTRDECDASAAAGSLDACSGCPARRRPCEPGYEYCSQGSAFRACVPVGTCGSVCRPGCDAPTERCVDGRCVARDSAAEASRNALACGPNQEVCFPDPAFGLPQGWCDQGSCQPESSMHFIDGLSSPKELVLVGETLYFFDGSDLKTANTRTREVRRVRAGVAGYALQRDATHAYWLNAGNVMEHELGDADAEIGARPARMGLAVNSTHFIRAGGPRVSSSPKAGGPSSVLADYDPGVDDVYVNLEAVAADDEVVAVSGRFDDPVIGGPDGSFESLTIPLNGAPATSGVSGVWPECSVKLLGLNRGVAYSHSSCYYDFSSVFCTRSMYGVATATASWRGFRIPCELDPESQDMPPQLGGFTGDARSVYLGLMRFDSCTSARTTLSDLFGVHSLAVDDTYLYFAKDDFIGRVPK
jgi:hypothetical protein